MNKWIRSDLKEYEPYKPNETPHLHKINANESPFSLSENVRQKLIKWLQEEENLNTYPDTNSNILRKTIGDFYGVDMDNVVCTVGLDEMIDFITKAFLEIGDNAIISPPTFYMYENSVIINRGNVIKVPLEKDFSLDENKIIEAYKKNKAKLIFLCTPNNPTGNVIPQHKLIKILDNVTCPVIVDEAYGEFAATSMIDKINQYENLIVMRTFSKAYGLAGGRIGYAIGNIEIIEAISIVKTPYNLSTISQLLAQFSIENSSEYMERVKLLKNEREFLLEELKQIEGLKVYDSESNFIYIKTQIPVYDKAIAKGILVRKYNGDIGENVRITVSTRDVNMKLINLLKYN